MVVLLGLSLEEVRAYNAPRWWQDGAAIWMDEAWPEPWRSEAWAMAEKWNRVDTADSSHPFLAIPSPVESWSLGDGHNTIGFLEEDSLQSNYGLSFESSMAWTYIRYWTSTNIIVECDIMLNAARPWRRGPDNAYWFQSTVLHELGHCRGLKHENTVQSIMNSGHSKHLRADDLYLDDKSAIRQHANVVPETDLAIFHKWHDGVAPRWMTMNPTTLSEGDIIEFRGVTVENHGTTSLGPVSMGVYLSSDATISEADQQIAEVSWNSFDTGQGVTFDLDVTMPESLDCGSAWLGGIVDSAGHYSEGDESNNVTIFTDGDPYLGNAFSPTSVAIVLPMDPHEPNNERGSSSLISLPFIEEGLSINEDQESDYYQFGVTKAGIVDIRVAFSHALGNIDLELLDEAGSTLWSSESLSDGESMLHPIDPGSYYVHVSGKGWGSCNRYDLSVQILDCLDDSDCQENNACVAAGTCHEGTCLPGSPVVCDDQNACTNDTCDSVVGCVFENNANACDDGNACTSGDICLGGECAGGSAVTCDDGNSCTSDTCDPSSGCQFVAHSGECTDQGVCSASGSCENGMCQPGPALDCDDHDPCTADSCSSPVGCRHDPIEWCEPQPVPTLGSWGIGFLLALLGLSGLRSARACK